MAKSSSTASHTSKAPHVRRWVLEFVFLFAVERSVNWFSPAFLPYVWFAVLVLATIELFYLNPVRGVIRKARSRSRGKRRLLLNGVLLLCAVLLLCFYWWGVNQVFKNNDLFSVDVRTSCVSDAGPLTAWMIAYPSSFGDTISPVFYLSYIQITNRQSIPSTINELRIAASKEPDGPWEDLVPIPLVGSSLYWLGNSGDTPVSPKTLAMGHGTFRFATAIDPTNLKTAIRDFVSPLLATELAKPIEPHQSVTGWIALDSPRRAGLSPGKIYFRVKLRDAVSAAGTYIVSLPRQMPGEPEVDINGGSIRTDGVPVDLSSFHVKYYNDPFPRPENVRPQGPRR